jgi:outer membrane lipoprotein-sorting protein
MFKKILKVFLLGAFVIFLQGQLWTQEEAKPDVKEEVVEETEKVESEEVAEETAKVEGEEVAEATPEEGEVKREIAEVKEYNAEEILKRADEVRNPSESFFMKVKVTNIGQEGTPSLFDVSIKGNNRTLIKTLLPKRDKGRNLLMLEENMWVYIPNLKRSVRVGLSQKLTGQAANGDISRMRWSGDYTASILKTTEKSWLLHLQATKKGLTYEQLKVLVSKKGFRPRQAHLMSVSGKLLKKIYYQNYKKLAGRLRPSQMNIVDAINENKKSIINIEAMEKRDFQTALFNKRSLAE